MKSSTKNRIFYSSLSILLWQFFILPFRSFAETITYHPLEGKAFVGLGLAENNSGDLGLFLSSAFQFGLAIAAALAVIMIVWGGVEIMLSESVFKKEDGKKKIQDAIWGLVLALVSWLILFTINPQILNWSFLAPKP